MSLYKYISKGFYSKVDRDKFSCTSIIELNKTISCIEILGCQQIELFQLQLRNCNCCQYCITPKWKSWKQVSVYEPTALALLYLKATNVIL